MKKLTVIIVGLLVCLVLVLLVLRATGLDPKSHRPGLWLKGDLVTTPIADWSFSDKFPTIEVQTRTWYMIPHSVTIDCTTYNGRLYLTSFYPAGFQYPNGRSWHRNVTRDPHVRLKIGNQLFNVIVSYVVTDPAEHAAVFESKVKKYPPYGHFMHTTRKPPAGETIVELRVVSD